MTFEDAMKRLAGCRALQPDRMQVIVSAEIVDALLARDATSSCSPSRVSIVVDSADYSDTLVCDHYGVAPACEACGADEGALCRRRVGYCPRTVA